MHVSVFSFGRLWVVGRSIINIQCLQERQKQAAVLMTHWVVLWRCLVVAGSFSGLREVSGCCCLLFFGHRLCFPAATAARLSGSCCYRSYWPCCLWRWWLVSDCLYRVWLWRYIYKSSLLSTLIHFNPDSCDSGAFLWFKLSILQGIAIWMWPDPWPYWNC